MNEAAAKNLDIALVNDVETSLSLKDGRFDFPLFCLFGGIRDMLTENQSIRFVERAWDHCEWLTYDPITSPPVHLPRGSQFPTGSTKKKKGLFNRMGFMSGTDPTHQSYYGIEGSSSTSLTVDTCVMDTGSYINWDKTGIDPKSLTLDSDDDLLGKQGFYMFIRVSIERITYVCEVTHILRLQPWYTPILKIIISSRILNSDL